MTNGNDNSNGNVPRRSIGYEPDFDFSVKYGGQGELFFGNILEWIAAGNASVEVKTKSYYDLDFYVEYECYSQRTKQFEPSGIQVTQAAFYSFVIDDSGFAFTMPTSIIRQALDMPWGKKRPRAHPMGENPTRGYMLRLDQLVAVAAGNIQ